MYGMLALATITPWAVPSKGETFASTVGTGENSPGSTIQYMAFPRRPVAQKVRSVPWGVVKWTLLAPWSLAAMALQVGATSRKSASNPP